VGKGKSLALLPLHSKLSLMGIGLTIWITIAMMMMKLTATDFMTDLIAYKLSKVKDKAALLAKWRKHEWSSDAMRQWANWQWKEFVG
jgi:hypothetical protein